MVSHHCARAARSRSRVGSEDTIPRAASFGHHPLGSLFCHPAPLPAAPGLESCGSPPCPAWPRVVPGLDPPTPPRGPPRALLMAHARPRPNWRTSAAKRARGPGGVAAVACAPGGFVRAPRPPATLDPARRPPAPRSSRAAVRGPQPTFWMVCCVTSPLPLGRADAKATDMVAGAGSALDHWGLFSGCDRQPEALILRSRWGGGGRGGGSRLVGSSATPLPLCPEARRAPI